MFASIRRSGLFLLVLLPVSCTESNEPPTAKQRQLSTTPPTITVHSEFGVDPSIPGLSGEDPDVAYNGGPQSPVDPVDPTEFTPPINGGIHLVVWSDGNDIWGERVSGDGAPLEPGQFVIDASDGAQTHPRVAPVDIDGWVVVYDDDRNGGGVDATFVDLTGSFVQDGNIVTPETPLAQGSGPYTSPAVACAWVDPTDGGFGCLVVWWNGSEITGEPISWDYGSRVFTVHDPMPISSAAGHGAVVESAASIAASGGSSTGQNYLVAWNESPIGGTAVNVHAAGLTVPNPTFPLPDSGPPLTPVVLGQPEITVAQDSAALAAPSVGMGFLVSWVKSTGASTGAVMAARVGIDGSVLDSPPLLLHSVGTSHGGSPPSSIGAGVVVWDDDQSGLFGARVTDAGNVVELGRAASAPSGGSLFHARGTAATQVLPSTGGREFNLVVWTQNAGSTDPTDRLNAAMQIPGAPSFEVPFAVVGAATPVGATVTGNASEFLVLWSGRGIRIGRDGRALDPQPFTVPTGAAASDGTNFAVVWSASGDIHGSKIGPGGALGPDVTIIAGPNPENSPVIASNGSNYVLLWLETDPTNGGTIVLHEAALDLDFTVRQTTTITSEQPDFLMAPAVASDGDAYMAVWPEMSPGCGFPVSACGLSSFGTLQIFANSIQADGSLPSAGSSFPVGEASGSDEFSPSIASVGGPGTGYVVAYTERSGNANGEIRAVHVWPPVTIGNPNLFEDSPSVGRICDESLVAWTRGDYTVSDPVPAPRDVIGATIANGTATELSLSNTTNDETNPATFGLGASSLLVYSTFSGVRARLVTGSCGGAIVDGGDAGGQVGGGGSSGASGTGGGAGVTGSGGGFGFPDAGSTGGATDASAGSGGASPGDAGVPDASGTGGSGGAGSGGVTNGGSGGENESGGHGGPGGKGGHGGKGGAHAGGADAGVNVDGGHGHGRDGHGCQTSTGRGSSTTGTSALAIAALSVVRRRSLRRRRIRS